MVELQSWVRSRIPESSILNLLDKLCAVAMAAMKGSVVILILSFSEAEAGLNERVDRVAGTVISRDIQANVRGGAQLQSFDKQTVVMIQGAIVEDDTAKD